MTGASKFDFPGISRVVQISSSVGTACEECKEPIKEDKLPDNVNHYILHGYKVLHIGSESSWAHNGSLWHSTIAVMGK